jgi:hypothetical protein
MFGGIQVGGGVKVNTYQVQIKRQGSLITTDTQKAKNASDAIRQTELRFNLNPVSAKMATNGQVEVIRWTGYEFMARAI